MDVYQLNGYSSREEYLRCLSATYGVPYHKVLQVANIYGEEEDFDALATWIEYEGWDEDE